MEISLKKRRLRVILKGLWSRKCHYVRNEDQMFSISKEHRTGRRK